MFKGVPQESISGPLLFNMLMNDILYFSRDVQLYNYADDNTLSHAHDNLDSLKTSLKNDSNGMIQLCNATKTKANPDKVQAIALGRKSRDSRPVFEIENVQIAAEDHVKLIWC
jgi:hypothetical protein